MLFAEFSGFAYTCTLFLDKGRESDDDSFGLHSFELLEIDVASPLVSHLYVGVGSLTLGIHCIFHLVRVEDEHLTLSSTAGNESTFFLNEAPFVIEANLHALFHNLANQD